MRSNTIIFNFSSPQIIMKKVLIVLNDMVRMPIFRSWVLRSQKTEELLFAQDGKEAIEIMKSHSIGLLVTALDSQEIDGLELATILSLTYPEVKIAFFLPTNSNIISKKLQDLTSINFFDKPRYLEDFIAFMDTIETIYFLALPMSDITTADFLTLVEYCEKTCLLAIENRHTKQKGFVYFEQGILYAAIYESYKADLAMLEMLSWQQTQITFKTFAHKQFRRQIQSSLSTLINHDTTNSMPEQEEQIVIGVTTEKNNQLDLLALKAEQEFAIKVEESAKAEAAWHAELAAKAKQEMQLKAQVQPILIKIDSVDVEKVLQTLQEIDDCISFVIFDMTGRVIAKHNAVDSAYDIENISVNAVVIIKSALETVNNLNLGSFNFMQITSDGGIFQASWVLENQLIAAVLLNPELKNTGLAKIRLTKVCEIIRSELLQQ